MRIRKKKWAEPELGKCSYFIKNPADYKGKWQESFGNKNPIHLEIGCGKCGFVAEASLKFPKINFIAVDIKLDMLGVGRRNIESVRQLAGQEDSPENIRLICRNVETIGEIFSPDDNIERLYINFCNPWPKAAHKKRRLTFPKKLELYKTFLKSGAEIHFKTDDDELFEESLVYFADSEYTLLYKTYDLHSSGRENIMTEHEKMFSSEGIKIKFSVFRI